MKPSEPENSWHFPFRGRQKNSVTAPMIQQASSDAGRGRHVPQHSRLLALPAELRQLIWAYSFSPVIKITLSTDKVYSHHGSCSADKSAAKLHRPKQMLMNEARMLLLVCQTVRTEVLSMFEDSMAFLRRHADLIIRMNNPLQLHHFRSRLPILESLSQVHLQLDLFEHSQCSHSRTDSSQMFGHFYDLIRQLVLLVGSGKVRRLDVGLLYEAKTHHLGRRFDVFTRHLIQRILTTKRPTKVLDFQPVGLSKEESKAQRPGSECVRVADSITCRLAVPPRHEFEMNLMLVAIQRTAGWSRIVSVQSSLTAYGLLLEKG